MTLAFRLKLFPNFFRCDLGILENSDAQKLSWLSDDSVLPLKEVLLAGN